MRNIGESRIYIVPELTSNNEQWINPDFGTPELRTHYDIVYLLKKAAKDHRHRKNSQRFKGRICNQIFIFRHDYIPS